MTEADKIVEVVALPGGRYDLILRAVILDPAGEIVHRGGLHSVALDKAEIDCLFGRLDGHILGAVLECGYGFSWTA